MSTTVPTPEDFKEKAKTLRRLLKEKYNLEATHGHCLDMVSELFGLKDWNTASAVSKTKAAQISLPMEIRTVGAMRRALAPFKDSDPLDAEYIFKIKDFLDSMDPLESPEDSIRQEFKLVLEHLDDGKVEPRIASFKLQLENEDLEIAPYTDSPAEPCDYWKNQAQDESQSDRP